MVPTPGATGVTVYVPDVTVAIVLAGNLVTVKLNTFVSVTAPLVIVAVKVTDAFPAPYAGLTIVCPSFDTTPGVPDNQVIVEPFTEPGPHADMKTAVELRFDCVKAC